MDQREAELRVAVFSPNVKTYIFLVALFYLLVSIIGWIVIPFWLLGLGKWLSQKYFDTLSCVLTNKNLKFSKGLVFHIEKTIPLENIQDLSFYSGPVLKALGLTLIRIETAGGGGKHDQNMMTIPGIIEAEAFKAEILMQREALKKENQKQIFTAPGTASQQGEILEKIHLELIAIRNALQAKL